MAEGVPVLLAATGEIPGQPAGIQLPSDPELIPCPEWSGCFWQRCWHLSPAKLCIIWAIGSASQWAGPAVHEALIQSYSRRGGGKEEYKVRENKEGSGMEKKMQIISRSLNTQNISVKDKKTLQRWK